MHGTQSDIKFSLSSGDMAPRAPRLAGKRPRKKGSDPIIERSASGRKRNRPVAHFVCGSRNPIRLEREGGVPRVLGRENSPGCAKSVLYADRLADPKENGLRENLNLASRIRRRTTTARYFYLLIVGLMDDKPVPAVPMLGDPVAERRLSDATADIKELISSVRSNPGPWQDPA